MSDKEIIDALEHCMKAECKNCPMFIKDNQSCKGIQIFDVVVLINRLKAEIARLERESADKERAYTEEYSFRKEFSREIKRLNAFKEYWDELYGTGLEISKWHLNGDTEPFDNFYDAAMEEMEKY